MEKEFAVSHRVKASTLEEVNLGTVKEPWPVSMPKEMPPAKKPAMVRLLTEFKDVFTWSYKDMKWMDLKFYQHQIHLSKDAKPVAQRRY